MPISPKRGGSAGDADTDAGKIAEYQEALENDTYAEDYPYEELKALYEENYELLHSLMEAWEITDLTASSQSAGPQGTSEAGGGSSVLGKMIPTAFIWC